MSTITNLNQLLNYEVSNYFVRNMKKLPNYAFNQSPIKFEIEAVLSIEEKLSVIDVHTDNSGSALLALIEKWNTEKDGLPQDYRGPKTVSKKAWYRRNNIESKNFRLSDEMNGYSFLRQNYINISTICPVHYGGHEMLYSGTHVVHQWFHSLLNILQGQETAHFKKHNSFHIKLNQVQDFGNKYGLLDSDIINDIVWNGKEDVTEDQLDKYLVAYEKLDKVYKELSKEIENI